MIMKSLVPTSLNRNSKNSSGAFEGKVKGEQLLHYFKTHLMISCWYAMYTEKTLIGHIY